MAKVSSSCRRRFPLCPSAESGVSCAPAAAGAVRALRRLPGVGTWFSPMLDRKSCSALAVPGVLSRPLLYCAANEDGGVFSTIALASAITCCDIERRGGVASSAIIA